MSSFEVIVVVRKIEPDGSYTEWQTKPGFQAFNAKARKEIERIIGVNNERI